MHGCKIGIFSDLSFFYVVAYINDTFLELV